VVSIIRREVPGKDVQGLAEALLIGYKHDLDKDLVQAYSRTGVVHIIAISGLHLGLVYALLLWLTRGLKRRTLLRLLLVLGGLWAFAGTAGAGPSVLRAALMFSCLALASLAKRRSRPANALVLSALILLCIQPYWLWDIGFQLSYAAVASILLFQQPLYRSLRFPNKPLAAVWQLASVTLAAQLLTLPLTVYHFHQLPLLFLGGNLLAVPLSSLLLFLLVLLCVLSPLPLLAAPLGKGIALGITLLNKSVTHLGKTSLVTWEGLSITAPQSLLLTFFLLCGGLAIVYRQRRLLPPSLLALLGFLLLRAASHIHHRNQLALVVYPTPGYSTIDLFIGPTLAYWGDTLPAVDEGLRRFHLQPTRTQFRAGGNAGYIGSHGILFGGKIILRTDSLPPSIGLPSLRCRLLVINRKARPFRVWQALRPEAVVIDGSVPARAAQRWQEHWDSLGIRCHSVRQKGAFVLQP
jgi:competence protein ComEC